MSVTMSEYSTEAQSERWRAQDVRALAALAMVTERTVYRWMREPERAHRGNAARLAAAALKLGIPLPVKRA